MRVTERETESYLLTYQFDEIALLPDQPLPRPISFHDFGSGVTVHGS